MNEQQLSTVASVLLKQDNLNSLLVFPHNKVKVVFSDASAAEYFSILGSSKNVGWHPALISFPLQEYLCLTGNSEEFFEVSVEGVGFKLKVFCRIDNNFSEAVYHNEGTYTQLYGAPIHIKEYKEKALPDAKVFSIAHLKSFFTMAFVIPSVGDDIKDVALRRSALRFAVAALNRFADCHRCYAGIPWATVPHYSFYSFPYGYIREFDHDGNIIVSNKYIMNPATGTLPERPFLVDPDGSFLMRFKDSLLAGHDADLPLNMFRKGEAYSGHGHDFSGIKLCVSAIEAILQKWAVQKNIELKGKLVTEMRLSDLIKKFENDIKQGNIDNIELLFKQARSAIKLRHTLEHESLQAIDSTSLFPAIATLKRFFEIVESELSKTASVGPAITTDR